MEGLDMEWISANLTNVMGAYWWILVGAVVGTAVVMLGLVAPIAERLQEAHGTLMLQATRRYR